MPLGHTFFTVLGILLIALGAVYVLIGTAILRADGAAGFQDYTPADAALDRSPYSLLPNPQPRPLNTALTAQACAERDYTRRVDKTGSFLQRTNNYPHASPDSCSAPFHELVNNFYAPPPPPPIQ